MSKCPLRRLQWLIPPCKWSWFCGISWMTSTRRLRQWRVSWQCLTPSELRCQNTSDVWPSCFEFVPDLTPQDFWAPFLSSASFCPLGASMASEPTPMSSTPPDCQRSTWPVWALVTSEKRGVLTGKSYFDWWSWQPFCLFSLTLTYIFAFWPRWLDKTKQEVNSLHARLNRRKKNCQRKRKAPRRSST